MITGTVHLGLKKQAKNRAPLLRGRVLLFTSLLLFQEELITLVTNRIVRSIRSSYTEDRGRVSCLELSCAKASQVPGLRERDASFAPSELSSAACEIIRH